MRSRLWLVAALASLTLGVAVPVASASNGTSVPPKVTALPPLDTVHVSGVGKNGKTFSGSYAIQRFVAGKHTVYAVGTLTGRLAGRHVTRYDVEIPASLTGASTPAGAFRTAQTTSCNVLHLVLGPVNLNLLGLQVTLGGGTAANQPIVLDLTAQQGGGLLGDLLCGVTNALSGSGALSSLQGNLTQLAATLNGLVSLLGAL